MKKFLSICTALLLLATLVGCKAPKAVKTVDTGLKTYEELDDGTWRADGIVYRYKIEVSGRLPRVAVESTFTYLSNLEEIPFERAWKAAGLSSSTEDYFSPEEAVLVDWRTK